MKAEVGMQRAERGEEASAFCIPTSAFPSKDLSIRTKDFALRVIRLYKSLPEAVEAQVIGKQILRSGTSVGAQYREAKRARSGAEFTSKMESALQELEETGYWLELLIEASITPAEKLKALCQEQNELTAIFVSSINRAKSSRVAYKPRFF